MQQKSDVSFLMLKCWNENIALLDDNQKAQLLTAIYDYQCNETDFVTGDGMLKMLWTTVKNTFNYNNQKYKERCEKNKKAAMSKYKNGNGKEQKPSFDINELDKIE